MPSVLMQPIRNKKILLQHLAQGDIVITPNNRLSAALLKEYYQNHAQAVIEKPFCMPYLNFLQNSYKKLLLDLPNDSHPLLLTPYQCQYLWQTILKSQNDFRYSKGLVDNVLSAWSSCVQWQISDTDSSFSYNSQCQQFQQWWQIFNQKLLELNVITIEQIPDYFIKTNTLLLAEKKLIWTCFDDFTPQQQAFQNFLRQQGIQQFIFDLEDRESKNYCFAASDEKEELQQMAAWVEQRLKAGEKKVAVIIPDLQQRALSLQRQLKECFSAELFNISLGKSLTSYPLIAHAFNWLSLEPKKISSHQAHLLLHSPYLKGSREELHSRIQLLETSSFIQEKYLSLSQWIKELNLKAPLLAQNVTQLTNYPAKSTPHQWVILFQQRLYEMGFPGDYSLNSENYQCFQSLEEVFRNFCQLQKISPELSAYEALEALKDIAQQTIFQPQSVDKAVHVLGLLEASGCEFDSLWIMGLTDQKLPQKSKLSPFIPHALQQEQNMPHSTAAREGLYAQKLIQRFQKASACNVFSFANMSGDVPNLGSPLLAKLPLLTPSFLPICNEKIGFDINEDDYCIPLAPQEKVSGGTRLLANQAKCPFRAFAEHRLHAKSSLISKEGLDLLERGQIIHKIMENIWNALKNQQGLLALSALELEKQIDSAILTALAPFSATDNYSFPKFIQEIEESRLKRLVHSCLDWEKQRPAFRVAALEQDFILRIGSIDFKVRVDRLDEDLENKKWVIDYKSSMPSSKPWKEERPKEPQLLLYALVDDAIRSLMFVELKAGRIATQSFSDEPLPFAGNTSLKKEESWEEYRASWRKELEILADEFSQGHCPPKPSPPSICEHCDFQNLCRFSAV